MVLVWAHPGAKDAAKFWRGRMIFTPNADGSARQYSDEPRDDGATWTERYDDTYRKAP